ncbi:MAG: hypothetical protein ACR2PL_23040, partial [Dehalococcoidia bacterium]
SSAPPSPPSHEDAIRVVALTISQAQAQIAWQLQLSAQRDAQAIAFIGVDLAGIAILAAVQTVFGNLWWTPSIALLVSAGCLGRAFTQADVNTGPQLKAFYERYKDAEALEAHLQMLSELLDAVEQNDAEPERKSPWYIGGLLAFAAAILIMVAIVAIRTHVFDIHVHPSSHVSRTADTTTLTPIPMPASTPALSPATR